MDTWFQSVLNERFNAWHFVVDSLRDYSIDDMAAVEQRVVFDSLEELIH